MTAAPDAPVLVGDIGGTKTILALYSQDAGVTAGPLHETRFASGAYPTFEHIVGEFLAATGSRPRTACFGVAGPVLEGQARITNLPWTIGADTVGHRFDIERVQLLNDLEAIATAVPHLTPKQLSTLNSGRHDPRGNLVVVAPGTGLGIAFSVWDGHHYRAFPTEAGHMSYAPRTAVEAELLRFLQERYGHVSYERVCSGSGLPNIYDFLKQSGRHSEPDWLAAQLSVVNDPTPLIVTTAQARAAEICVETLDLFVQILGSVVGNLGLSLLPGGGIYLGGGIPPRIIERLQQPDFLAAAKDKGRFSDLCAGMPLHVILEPKAALHGAAWAAMVPNSGFGMRNVE